MSLWNRLINIIMWLYLYWNIRHIEYEKNDIISSQSSISGKQLVELEKIGLVIRELRFNFGLLTQKELADRCGVHLN